MSRQQDNVALVQRFGAAMLQANYAAASELVADALIWHYFNPRLPGIQGDYAGLEGVASFFNKLSEVSSGTFTGEPICMVPFGDEFVLAQARIHLNLGNSYTETTALVVWRVHANRIIEVWDIPAIYTARSTPGPNGPHCPTP